MKAKQATVKPKLVSQLEKHACFCPPTKHDTKLDQLNKAKEKQALFFFFFFFFFGRERYSLHKCNDSNLKSM